MTRLHSSRSRLLLLMLALFSFLAGAQNKTAASLSSEEYSKILIQRYHEVTGLSSDSHSSQLNRGRHNLTMLLIEAKRNSGKLTPEAKTVFKALDVRPTGLNKTYLETTKNFFRFYYTTTGSDAVATADLNTNGVPDYVENMAAAFIRALDFYDSLGYNRPPIASLDNGRYSVYISSANAGDYVYGYSAPETTIGNNPATPLTEVTSTTSYMVMRSEYDDFGNTQAEKQIAMEVTAAHEFFHAVQFGYEYDNMEGYLMEMASTWAEDRVFPGDDDNWQYLTDIFDMPDVSTDWDEYLDGDAVNYSSDYAMHWYAAWIFMRYLSDHYGDELPKLIFEANINSYTSAAINSALTAKGTTYAAGLKDYYIAIGLLTQSTTAPMNKYRMQRANDYRTLTVNSGGSPAGPFVVKYEKTINYSGTKITYSSTTSGNKRLMRASADYLKIVPTSNFSVKVTPKTANSGFDIRLIKADSYTNPTSLSVVEPVAASGSYSINVADYASGAKYILVIYNARYSTPSSRDTTSTQYDIVVDKSALTDGINITSPVGGESWQAGSIHNITWESANVTNVKIEYTTNSGTNWQVIAASVTASTASYAWTVPQSVSAACKVRISDAANSAVYSESPAVFSIIQPLPFGITSPIGGESWQVGSIQKITWNPNTVVNVKIEYTTNNGTDWTTIIASAQAAMGSYSWTVPNTLSASCKVKISDAANSAVTSVSAAAFSIVPAVIQTVVLSEDFALAVDGTLASPSGTDVSGSLNTYTSMPGWTGAKVYQAGGVVKMGSSSALGYIVTPTLDLSASSGRGSVKFDIMAFGTDTNRVQVFFSTDGGTTFNQLGGDIPVTTSMVTYTLDYQGGNANCKFKFTAKIATKNRFFLDNVKVTSGSVTAVNENNKTTMPEGFVLMQNYPNPFNPSTLISFSIPEKLNVKLEVFNQLGERVADLISGEMHGGLHSVTWNASGYVSGIYFCRLSAGNVLMVKKMLLLK